MNLLSICNKLYNKLAGKDVQKIQNDIINSLEKELADCRRLLLLKDNRHQREVGILQGRIEDLADIRTALAKELHTANNKPDVQPIIEKQFTMTEKVYDDLVKSLEPPIVTNNTTAQGAGYLVGMQRVLSEIRKRYVAGN
jgi:hypothetical protein